MGRKACLYPRLYLLLSFVVLVPVILLGCKSPNKEQVKALPLEQQTITYPLTLKDQDGNNITIQKQPQRIVSLVPSNTEIAFALHLDKQVVGVTTLDDYPTKVKSLPKIGDVRVNLEKVMSLKPDLVLASLANGTETIDRLRKSGLTVLVLDAHGFNDVYASITLVGKATNHLKEAASLLAQIEERKKKVVKKISSIPDRKRVKVWVELDPNLYTAGGNTFIHELITLAGGKNVAAHLDGWPQISSEQVAKWNPDVVLSTYGREREIMKRKGWRNIAAIRNHRVYRMDANVVNRPGPRLVAGLEKMAQLFYPEQIDKKNDKKTK